MGIFKKSIVLGTLLLAGLAVNVFAASEIVRVHNLTGYDLSSLYITPTRANTWGNNLISGQGLQDGNSTDIEFTVVNGNWYWDMRATDTQGDTVVWRNMNLQGASNIYLWVDKSGDAEVRIY